MDGNVEDETVEAGVRDEEITTAAKDKDRERAVAGEGYCFKQLRLSVDLGKVACRAADVEGGVGSERDVLLDGDRGLLHGIESTTRRLRRRKDIEGEEFTYERTFSDPRWWRCVRRGRYNRVRTNSYSCRTAVRSLGLQRGKVCIQRLW